MTEAYPLLSWAATIATVGLFSTGVKTCYDINRRGNTDNVQFLPLVLTAFNCVLWSSYGVMKGDSTLVLVNFTGVVLQTAYVTVYFFYSRERKHPLIVTSIIAATGVFIMVLVTAMVPPEGQLNQLGICCTIITVLMFASPLAAMAKVISMKSTELMSFPFSFMVFVVSSLWFLYGYSINDIFIQVPNGMGALLGIVQLSLFFIYGSSPRTSLPH